MSAPYEGSATNGFAIFDQRLVQKDVRGVERPAVFSDSARELIGAAVRARR
ncbi:hypothetical protein AB0M13_04670 [Nocardia fluminea]|uniref:hypothetical protein n=1 Tax=Nocardia fluminea TaxID=134984 RepID=UPI00341D8287